MPFNVGESVNYVSDKFTESSFIKKVIKNPFYTALMIVAIIVLIILFVFRNVDFSDEDESLGKLVFRSSIYMILVVTGVQFLNNQIWSQDMKNKNNSAELGAIFGGVEKLQNSINSPAGNYTHKGAGIITVNVGGLSTTGSAKISADTQPETVPANDITN